MPRDCSPNREGSHRVLSRCQNYVTAVSKPVTWKVSPHSAPFTWTPPITCTLRRSLSIFSHRKKHKSKLGNKTYIPNVHAPKRKGVVQQRILQARGHSTGAVTSQALPTLRAVPGELLVLPCAQHPLQFQNKQDHRHSALMCWKKKNQEMRKWPIRKHPEGNGKM